MKSRAQQNKDIRRESLREELKSKEYLRQIHRILNSEHGKDNVPEAQMKLTGYFKLLGKTLPDLKAVEMDIRNYDSATDSDIDTRIDQILAEGTEDRSSETVGTEGAEKATKLH